MGKKKSLPAIEYSKEKLKDWTGLLLTACSSAVVGHSSDSADSIPGAAIKADATWDATHPSSLSFQAAPDIPDPLSEQHLQPSCVWRP